MLISRSALQLAPRGTDPEAQTQRGWFYPGVLASDGRTRQHRQCGQRGLRRIES